MINNKKSALVTGANRGIGFQIVKDLIKAGFFVYLTSRNSEKGKRALDEIDSPNCEFLQMDVTNIESIKETFTIVSEYLKFLDVLINNAGVMHNKNILSSSIDSIDECLKTNTLGALFVSQIFDPLLTKGSRVINLSSSLGIISKGMNDYSPVYSISKCALNAVTCQLSYAYKAKGVAVNSMCPGWVRTDMGGKNAERDVEKGAETAIWLATEAPIELTGKFFRDKKEINF